MPLVPRKLKTSNNNWRTPPELIAGISATFGVDFVFDLFASTESTIAPGAFWGPEAGVDAYYRPWADAPALVPAPGFRPALWANPPYGETEFSGVKGSLREVSQRWRDHVYYMRGMMDVRGEGYCQGPAMFALVPSHTATWWFREFWHHSSRVYFFDTRIQFIPEDGSKAGRNNHESALFIFNARPVKESWIGHDRCGYLNKWGGSFLDVVSPRVARVALDPTVQATTDLRPRRVGMPLLRA